MTVSLLTSQAINREPNMCWECYACIKACPEEAIQIRGYSDAVPLGATLTPQPRRKSIKWSIQFRGGEQKSFEYPTRTILADTNAPFDSADVPLIAERPLQLLFGESVQDVPIPAQLACL